MNLSRLALAADSIDVCSPFDGRLIGTVPRLEACAVPYLLQQARQGVSDCAALPRYQRARILERAALNIERDAEHFARLIVDEAGKTLKQAQKEVKRCINTLKLSAEEAKRNAGEVLPFDAYEGSENRQGWFSREPLGLILAITPYNDPLNLVAHKLGPAIAGGNGVILKPSELAPLSAIKLVDYLRDAGLPTSVVTLATGGADLGKALVEAREVRMVSFTGGFVTGEQIARSAGLKKLVMDLGGNAPVIVMTDCDLAATVESCVSGAFWAAGQNCIGTQRLLVQASIYEAFREAFVRLAREQVSGDPLASSTDIGPMISLQAAQNAQKVVDEALQQGARLLCGHQRRGSCYAATVLENVDHGSRLWQDEVFAPVVVLQPFDDLDQAIAWPISPNTACMQGSSPMTCVSLWTLRGGSRRVG